MIEPSEAVEKSSSRSRRRLQPWRKALAALVAMSLLGLIGLSSPASARATHVQVRGTGLPAAPGEGSCLADAEFALQMSGTLEGCLSINVVKFTCRKSTDGIRPDRYIEWTSEFFDGVLNAPGFDGAAGTFELRSIVRATMAPGSNCDFGQQLSGGCVHRMIGRSGTGVFENGRSVLRITDIIPDAPGAATNFTYKGYVRIAAGAVG